MVTKLRSPNYPTIDLETALEQLRKLYDKVRMGEFLARDAAGAWNYNSVSGSVKSTLAAMRQYGLIEGKVRGKNAENPRISRRGLTLLRRNQASREYQDELKNAALAPQLFKETYNTLTDATDEVIRDHLLFEKRFTDNGAQRYIEVYRATLELANLNMDDDKPRSDYDDSNKDLESETDETSSEFEHSSKQTPMMKITLSTEGEYAKLLPGKSSADWEKLLKILDAYKDMLVQDETESQDST